MNSPQKLRSLFDAAMDIESVVERQAFIDSKCMDEPDLKEQLQGLLAALEDAESFLESGIILDETTTLSGEKQKPSHTVFESTEPGTMIGRYLLKEKIGSGGFGLVFLAQQQAPVKCPVAIKLIKPGMDTTEVLARFNAERQSLAMMNHPGIASILDAGATESGRPYFVMELVEGDPITEYCDANQLTPRQRLEIFHDVCSAVQHAHQKGVIHRDIKPNNILVTQHDGKPVAKVIDFGIAKAIGDQLTEDTIRTRGDQLVGTPLYMSPEQAAIAGNVDVRSDVFALGILLYELLTGSTPITRNDIKDSGMDEFFRLLRESETPRPSSRVTESNQAIAEIAAKRNTEPARLKNIIKGDLDWIVAKALEKEPDRRYDTAIDFGRDIQRFLRSEPIEAHPPSATYRIRKFVRKNKFSMATALAFGIVLIGATIFSSRQAYLAKASETKAIKALNEEQKAKNAEAKQRAIAESATTEAQQALATVAQRSRKLQAVSNFLLETLRSPDPAIDGSTITVAQLLRSQKEKLDGAFVDDLPTRATVLLAIGKTYSGLGLHKEADSLLVEATGLFKSFDTGPPSRETLDSLYALAVNQLSLAKMADGLTTATELYQAELKIPNNASNQVRTMNLLGTIYDTQGDYEDSEAILLKAIKLANEELGQSNDITLQSNQQLANTYESMGKNQKAAVLRDLSYQTVVELHGENDYRTFEYLNTLGLSRISSGDNEKAVKIFEKLVKLSHQKVGDVHPSLVTYLNNWGSALLEAGRDDDAIEKIQEALAMHRKHFDGDFLSKITLRRSLAKALVKMGDFDEALELGKGTLTVAEEHLSDTHPMTLSIRSDLAFRYKISGDLRRATSMMRGTYRRAKKRFGESNPKTLVAMVGLAGIYEASGRLEEAKKLYEEAMPLQDATRGKDHQDASATRTAYGKVLVKLNQLDDAIKLLSKNFERQKEVLTESHRYTWDTAHELATAYMKSKKYDLGLPLREQVLKNRLRLLGKNNMQTMDAMNALGLGYLRAGQHAAARPHLVESIELSAQRFGRYHNSTLAYKLNLAFVEKNLGNYDASIKIFRQVLKQRRKTLGELNEKVMIITRELAKTYVKAGRKEEALETYEDMIVSTRQALAANPLGLSGVLGQTGLDLAANGLFDSAEKYVKESISIRAKKMPERWEIYEAKCLLGAVKTMRAKSLKEKQPAQASKLFKEIEQELLLAFEEMEQRASQIPRPIRNTVLNINRGWITKFYEASGDSEKLESWKKKGSGL